MSKYDKEIEKVCRMVADAQLPAVEVSQPPGHCDFTKSEKRTVPQEVLNPYDRPQRGKPMVDPGPSGERMSSETIVKVGDGLTRALDKAELHHAREERGEAKRVGAGPAMETYGVDVTDRSEDPVLMERIGEVVP